MFAYAYVARSQASHRRNGSMTLCDVAAMVLTSKPDCHSCPVMFLRRFTELQERFWQFRCSVGHRCCDSIALLMLEAPVLRVPIFEMFETPIFPILDIPIVYIYVYDLYYMHMLRMFPVVPDGADSVLLWPTIRIQRSPTVPPRLGI